MSGKRRPKRNFDACSTFLIYFLNITKYFFKSTINLHMRNIKPAIYDFKNAIAENPGIFL